MIDDKISKPSAGRFFPLSTKEIINQIKELSFKVHSYNERLPLMFQNCEYKTDLGYQLASFSRMGYLAIFSLPESVATNAAANALNITLEEFSKIDKSPQKTTKKQQFVIYRAYLGELYTVVITEDIIQAGNRWYLLYKKVAQVTKGSNLKHQERIIQKNNTAQSSVGAE